MDAISPAVRGDLGVRQVLVDFNDTSIDIDHDRCLHELFADRAATDPDTAAVFHCGRTWTFRQIDTAANRLAHHLRDHGVGRRVRVGLCLHRGPDLLIAMLAVGKAGGAFVVLDPDYPAVRLKFLRRDADCAVLVTEAALVDATGPVVLLDRDAAAIAARDDRRPDAVAGPDDLAYVVYTSGSTGWPKGIMVRHRGVVNNLHDLNQRFGVEPGDRVLAVSSISFDVTVYDLLGVPIAGGAAVIPEPDRVRDPTHWHELVRRYGVTIWNSVPSLLELYLSHLTEVRADPVGLRVAMQTGDWLDLTLPDRLRPFAPAVRVFNLGGATEASIYSTIYEAGHPASGWIRMPYGRPMANQRAYILDEAARPVPIGEPGELHLAGVGLAEGYLGRSELTAEKFVDWSYGPVRGERLYKTGDLARWRPDGLIELLGRMDFQVKIRGLRIEPGEIEAALRTHPGVAEAAVTVTADGEDKQLVAFVVPADREQLADPAALREHLRRLLPDYMVPSHYVPLAALPLSPNGKVDRSALRVPDRDDPNTGYAAPRKPVQQVLTEIWAELLGVERVGLDDDFFARGGHSLQAIKLIARVNQALGTDLPLRDLLSGPSPRALAAKVSASGYGGPTGPPPRPRAEAGPVPLSYTQQRIWFMEQIEPGTALYHVPVVLDLRGRLDRRALTAALTGLVARHEGLRTRFPAPGGVPRQEVLRAAEVPMPYTDLTGAPDAQERAVRLVDTVATAPFDLTTGAPPRAHLLRLAADEHRLLLTFHHIAVDAWSLEIVFRELGALYGAAVTGQSDPLPAVPLHCPDYAVWQRARLADGDLDEMVDRWRDLLGTDPVVPPLPADRPRPDARSFRGALATAQIGPGLVDKVRRLSRRTGVTTYMTLLAGFQALLADWTGGTEVTIGTPVAGRTRPELDGVVGCLINMVPVRTDLSGGPDTNALLGRVRCATLDAFARQDLPFDQLVEALVTRRARDLMPLFRVMFSYLERTPAPTLAGVDGCELTLESPPGTAKFELSLVVQERDDGGLTAALEYDSDLFTPATPAAVLDAYQRVLERFVDAPDRPVLPLTEGVRRDG